MSDLTPDQATSRLADCVSIWRLSPADVDQVIDTAVTCLVAGVDTPTLRELAGASPSESRYVIEPMIEDTLHELGMGHVLTANAQRAALTAMLRRFKDNQLSRRELARWAHTNIGHDGDADCQVFVDLDDMYDTIDYSTYSAKELDQWAVEEAEAFVEGMPSPGRTNVWHTSQEPSAVISGPKRWRRRFTVRIVPSGRTFSASNWDDLWSSLPELGVPSRNVAFESDKVKGQVLKRWGSHPDAPSG